MSLSIAQTTSTSAATGATTSAAGATTSASMATEQTFLKLLVAQLANQDPLQPTQGTEFVTQLAQFAQVEQSQNQTTQLTNMSSQLAGLSNNDTTMLVGKTVTIQGSAVTFDGTTATPSSVTLGGAAADVKATITDASGAIVRTIDLGAKSAGVVSIPWDGHEDSGAVAPAGTYTVNVSATDTSGSPVTVTQSVTGVVQNVSFAQGFAQLTLTSGAKAPISQLVSVGTPTSP